MRILPVEPIKALLANPKRIAITTHHKPDGDAMGSSLGLYNYLKEQGHSVTVVAPTDYPDFLAWMPGNAEVVNFDLNPDKAAAIFADAELLFVLDFNSPKRVEKMENLLKTVTCTKIMLDHHLSPEDFCEYTFSYSDACATCELVYDFIASLGDADKLSKASAACLYTGIMTDTGSFRFASMTANVHRVVAKLIDAGAENYKIHEAIYDNASEERLRLLGYALNTSLRVLPDMHVAYMSLTKEELNRFNHQTGDTEGLVNFALGIKGVKMAAFFVERSDKIKISFRSKGQFSVKAFSEKHFNGGGHFNASGGQFVGTIEDAVNMFTGLLPSYKEALSVKD